LTANEEKLPGQDSNLDKENQNLLATKRKSLRSKTSAKAPERPDRAWTKRNEKPTFVGSLEAGVSDPDLARVMAAWPGLAEPIRRAMLALVESVSRETRPAGKGTN
jgi:hypothetical protein